MDRRILLLGRVNYLRNCGHKADRNFDVTDTTAESAAAGNVNHTVVAAHCQLIINTQQMSRKAAFIFSSRTARDSAGAEGPRDANVIHRHQNVAGPNRQD